MKYDNLLYELFFAIPEIKATIENRMLVNEIDEEDGMHVIFGMVVVPFIVELLDKKETEKIQTAFYFLEKMAVSEDPMICEVLEFTVLEDFISRGKDFLEKCEPYMGKETLMSCQLIKDNMFY